MKTEHLYDNNFPEKHKVEELDVVSLYHEGRFAELDAVIICKDINGRVTATFGQSNWDCFPFSRKKQKNTINFIEFEDNKELQRELKLLTFGWLFNKSPRQKKALSFTGTQSRQTDIKRVYRFLASENLTSIKYLFSPLIYAKFERHLQKKEYTIKTLTRLFVAINGVIHDSSWHRLELDINPIKSNSAARKLSGKDAQQTLVIPERLCNAIYGKAINLIETALPYAYLISDTENAIQANYLKGRQSLDEKVANGKVYSFIKYNGGIDKQKYAAYIRAHQPEEPKSIIAPLSLSLPKVPLKNLNDFNLYLGQLITASYIVCGGFSGMRDSELDKLTPNSYYKDSFNGRDYHMLQSNTFKLGEKRDTWVTAATSKKAIDLMTILTERWRKNTAYPDPKYINTLWVYQGCRSQPPKLITEWNHRLSNFCKQLNLVVTEDDYQECLESNPRSSERVKKYVIVGKPWHFSTHQFRRTLAFYCIKNRLGTLVALKQQFKHLFLSMTEWYTNGGKLASLRNLKVDSKVQQALNDVNAETTANIIFKQWHSDSKLSGSHGKAIMKMRGDVPTIYSSWDVIYHAVKDGKLTLHGTVHSYCKSGYDCNMDGVIAPQFCVDCSSGSSIIDEQQAKWWKNKHLSLTAYMTSGENISISERSHYITQVRAAERVMKDFDIEFKPFEPELKVIGV
ncbi:hypothetical protein [Aeromonas enteropelogenes]|uniref:hypothetical protein n=1 Tax=Aeromonas enteropelogenes TaxID=29489 RepID=UPI003B9FB44E